MSWIVLENMRFHGFHGVHAEEKLTGADYSVDVHLKVNTKKAAALDDLAATVNYETVYTLCEIELAKPRQLLERVAYRIINELMFHFANLEEVKVWVSKLNPPLGGQVSRVYVESSFDLTVQCPSCQKKFICYNDYLSEEAERKKKESGEWDPEHRKTCWCHAVHIHPKTREMLKQQFIKCICPVCLHQYAG